MASGLLELHQGKNIHTYTREMHTRSRSFSPATRNHLRPFQHRATWSTNITPVAIILILKYFVREQELNEQVARAPVSHKRIHLYCTYMILKSNSKWALEVKSGAGLRAFTITCAIAHLRDQYSCIHAFIHSFTQTPFAFNIAGEEKQ